MSNSTATQLRNRAPRLAEAAAERARLTVVPRRRVRAARVPFVSLVTLVLLGGVVGLLLFNTQMQQASFAATALEQQADDLAAREQTLAMEVERLRDPQVVAQRATDLGMVVASAPAFLDLDSGRVHGEPRPAGEAGRLRIQERAPALPAVLAPAPEVVEVEAPPEGVLAGSATSGRDTERGADRNRGRDGRTSQESQQSQQGGRQQARQQSQGRR